MDKDTLLILALVPTFLLPAWGCGTAADRPVGEPVTPTLALLVILGVMLTRGTLLLRAAHRHGLLPYAKARALPSNHGAHLR